MQSMRANWPDTTGIDIDNDLTWNRNGSAESWPWYQVVEGNIPPNQDPWFKGVTWNLQDMTVDLPVSDTPEIVRVYDQVFDNTASSTPLKVAVKHEDAQSLTESFEWQLVTEVQFGYETTVSASVNFLGGSAEASETFSMSISVQTSTTTKTERNRTVTWGSDLELEIPAGKKYRVYVEVMGSHAQVEGDALFVASNNFYFRAAYNGSLQSHIYPYHVTEALVPPANEFRVPFRASAATYSRAQYRIEELSTGGSSVVSKGTL